MSARAGFLYVEHARVDVVDGSIAMVQADSENPGEFLEAGLPVALSACLLLGPGVSITHEAVRRCADEGCLIQWVGEQGVRLYSAGRERSKHIEAQAQGVVDPERRLGAARRLYRVMWGQEPPPRMSIEALRGFEGSWVRQRYAYWANQYGVPWRGRLARAQEGINSAINTATSTLYGATEAVIIALGLSPGLGIVHRGDARSLVFDIADTVKFET
ncbi:MAG: type I-E CRISPR-associated endonuclease Cas1e, partial [Acidiferrobacteraceae bacterium]